MIKQQKLYKLKKYLFETKVGESSWLAFNLLNYNYILVDEPFSAVDIEELDKHTSATLKQLGFISYSSEEELHKKQLKDWEDWFRKNYSSNTQPVEITIHPTYQCNFRCSYCFQPEILQKETREETEYMSPELFERMFQEIRSKVDITKRTLKFTVCGGEVFLGNKRSFEFINALIQKAQAYNIPLHFTTNGYNTNKYLPILKKHNKIAYTITIDGIPNQHNKRRFLANGNPTFTKLIENVEKILRETEHKIHLRINVDDENVDSLDSYFQILKNKGWLENERIAFYISPIIQYTYKDKKQMKPNTEVLLKLGNTQEIIRIVLENKINNVKFQGTIMLPVLHTIFWKKMTGVENALSCVKHPIIVTCASNQGIFGCIDFKGDVSPCSYDLAPKWGNVCTDGFIDYEQIENWQSVDFLVEKYRSEPCIDCKYFYICDRRQCSFYTFDKFNKKMGYCDEIQQSIETFFKKNFLFI